MRIGIVPVVNPFGGGIFQYSQTFLDVLDNWKEEGGEDDFVIFAPDSLHPALTPRQRSGWEIKPLWPPTIRRKLRQTLVRLIGGKGLGFVKNLLGKSEGYVDPDVVSLRPELSAWFRSCGVDLMLYPTPTTLPFETDLPYVMVIHDLQHRLQADFPEVTANREWETREYIYCNATRYATLIVADTVEVREDILNFYEPYISSERVKVLRFLAPPYLDSDVTAGEIKRVRETYQLPEQYLFYPAQFWPHKNQHRLIEAIDLLREKHGLDITLACCGSHSNDVRELYFQDVIALARQKGLASQVKYLGYVPDGDMSALYAGAIALTIPTHFGPTNIPILEAWGLGCPVLTSDVRGIRELVGDAGILVDPRSVKDIADGILKLWTDNELCRILIDRGRQRFGEYTPEDFRRILLDILEEAKNRVRTEEPVNVKETGRNPILLQKQ
jgi:glycosyltransferase involved in cell wall biosynthesis